MSKREPPTKDQFLKDISEHQMQILKNDGVYRHIRFAMPDSQVMHFDLITYPNHLVYSGDMGSYIFKRSEDMFFWFFRDNSSWFNPGYRAEKLVGTSVYGDGHSVFCAKHFCETLKETVQEQLVELKESEELDDDVLENLEASIEELYDDLLGESEAALAYEIFDRFSRNTKHLDLEDAFEGAFRYTFHFIWALYAIEWGVLQYFEKSAQGEAA